MQKILIFPFNGNGLEALDCIEGQFELIGFVDDVIEKQGKSEYGFEVFGRGVIDKYKEAKVLAVPGSPQNFLGRSTVIQSLKLEAVRFATVIHSKASVSKHAKIGYNTLIMAGVVITSNCVIGNHVCILPNSVVHHDTTLGDYTLIGSNTLIAGNVSVGENCYIASGSNIINGIEIGSKSLVGLGSNVINSLNTNSKVVGNPAKQI
jgi:sugar O-acyltransferase (sialic acid O-acetyltransferase NeuD family)